MPWHAEHHDSPRFTVHLWNTLFLFIIQGKLLQDDQPTYLYMPQHIAAYFWELRRQESPGSTSQLKYCDTPLINGATTWGWQLTPHNSCARMYCQGSHTWRVPKQHRSHPGSTKVSQITTFMESYINPNLNSWFLHKTDYYALHLWI